MLRSAFAQLITLMSAFEPTSVISPEIIKVLAQGGVSILTILAIAYLLKSVVPLVTSLIEGVTRLITSLLQWVVRLVEMLVSQKSKDT
jgi:hypothetical protein